MDNYNILNILDNFIEIYHNNKNYYVYITYSNRIIMYISLTYYTKYHLLEPTWPRSSVGRALG